jgi:AcrR family transcriptional regulator
MADDVRARLAQATAELMAERGYEGLSTAAIAARAGVEEAEFERRFDDLQDCVLQAYWYFTEDFNSFVYAAYEAEEVWREGFRAAAYAAARYVRDHPEVVRFGTIEMFSAGLMAQAYRQSHLQQMVDLIDAGREELDDPDSVGRGVAEATFGSIYELIVKEVGSGRGTGSAEDFVPDLMYIAVRPYLGHERAREELTIPPPPEPARPPS